jgi:predicted nucleotidyltransferase component of viral defense system
MRDLARRSENDRRDLFRAAAQAMRVHEAIIEKDFWVCWVLDYLFQDSPWKTRMAFKGGTSLSKAFHAIERFSEDIDLVLEWQLLGYSKNEPWNGRSATQQDAFGKEANRARGGLFGRQDHAYLASGLE